MKSNIREWNMWTWSIFGSDEDNFIYFPWLMITGTIAVVVGTPLAIEISPFFIFMMIGLIVSGLTGPNLHRIHALDGVPKPARYTYGTSYNLYRRGEFYLTCNKEERRSYPDNILDILKNKDLTTRQKKQLDSSMLNTSQAILERRKALAALEAKNIDVDSVLEYMSEQRKGLESDTKTYREFA